MLTRFAALLFVALVPNVFPIPAAGQVPEQYGGWENLKKVTHRRYYTVALRDSTCSRGTILEIGETFLTLKTWVSQKKLTIPRQDILRVGDNGVRVLDAVYSGRSSWSDVKDIPRNPHEGALVVSKDGKKHKGRVTDVSDADITLSVSGKAFKIDRISISQVTYVRFKPMTASAEYDAQEMFLIDPQLWPYLLHIEGKISVLLYDSSMLEMDTPIKCPSGSML